MYDGRVGRWMTIDPMEEFWSPYTAMGNDPVNLFDPNGGTTAGPEWIPGIDKRGNIILTAEAGDDLSSLISFFGSLENAESFLPKYALNERITFNEGDQIRLSNNVFSTAIRTFESNFINSDGREDNSYNCHTACIFGVQGIDFSNMRFDEVNIGDYDRDLILMEKFNPISPKNAIVGKTIITFNRDHSAVFFGRDRSGVGYVFEKPDFLNAPTISKTRDVSNRTGGIKPSRAFRGNDFGYYNLLNF